MKFAPSVLFTIILLLFFGATAWEARNFPILARILPWVVTIPCFFLTLRELLVQLRVKADHVNGGGSVGLDADQSNSSKNYKKAAWCWIWLFGLYIGIWVVGFKVATIMFLILFLKIEGRATWFMTTALTALAFVMIFVYFGPVFGVFWPIGWGEQLIKDMLGFG